MTDTPKTIAEIPALKPCPFCGRRPIFGLTKKTGCQLHGEPMQHVTLGCGEISCPARAGVVGGDVYNVGKDKARDEAIAAWNRRALPADDAEMVERVGRRLCAEKCAFYGDPPCWKMAEDEGLDWTGGAATAARCDEDCIALARAALSAMRGEP